jgi:hypothetical protein
MKYVWIAVILVGVATVASLFWRQRHQRSGESPYVIRSWLTTEKTYEGFPLLLRRPNDFEVDSLRSHYPTLVVVTHEFTKRKPNGLPEPDYNNSLIEMDCELVAAFDVGRTGVPALVETFGGKRQYYFYVSQNADVPTTISAIARRYPAERLSWTVHPDPKWGFIEGYAREHF